MFLEAFRKAILFHGIRSSCQKQQVVDWGVIDETQKQALERQSMSYFILLNTHFPKLCEHEHMQLSLL